ncbi:MAG TPA: IPT/TIG domain-containing protein, partial [Gemmatimonadaceae bacterium]
MSARRVLALTSMLTIAGVGCGGGGAGDTTTPLPSVPTTEGPPPVISSIAPARVCAASAFTLVVRGTGFDGRSVVRLNGAARTTTVVSETELRTGIAATDLTGSSATITVATGTQVGTSSATLAIGGSSSMTLTGAPTGGTAVGQPTFTLPIDGMGFTTSSVATWNGARRPTTYVSASRIVATVDAVDLSAPGQFTIGVADTTDNCPGAGALPFGVLAVGAPTSSSLKAIQTWSTALLW